jgi:hypothetical protein
MSNSKDCYIEIPVETSIRIEGTFTNNKFKATKGLRTELNIELLEDGKFILDLKIEDIFKRKESVLLQFIKNQKAKR